MVLPPYGLPRRAVYRPGGGPVHDESLPLLTGGFTLTADAGIASGALGGGWPVAFQHGGAGLRIGHDAGLPVEDGYRPPARWNGTVHRIEIDTAPVPDPTPQDGLRTALHSD
ncbi:MAG TPA: hypothetical protein VFV01_19860 [Spirillospora sp.]|nr:hypothetical protein [Spirillospora sp.]